MSSDSRPLYRWKSFWLGVLVLVFLGWAWLVSMDSLRGAGLQTALGWIVAAQFQGELCIASKSDISPWGGAQATTLIVASGTGGSPEYLDWWEGFSAYGLSVPHWFLILIFLIPWTAFLAWRWQRMSRTARPQRIA